MDGADLARLQARFERDVRQRFPDAPIDRVAVLQYGDDPEVEPGELIGRVYLEARGDRSEREGVLQAFHDTYRDAIRKLRHDLDGLPEAGTLEFVVSPGTNDEERGPIIKMKRGRGAMEAGAALVPVMARLGPGELETVDTLITAGIASNRAEAIRWALARIRERPAYEQLRERAREIEELRGQF
jgi:glycosyltransferase involved in cell wall biosynthesis